MNDKVEDWLGGFVGGKAQDLTGDAIEGVAALIAGLQHEVGDGSKLSVGQGGGAGGWVYFSYHLTDFDGNSRHWRDRPHRGNGHSVSKLRAKTGENPRRPIVAVAPASLRIGGSGMGVEARLYSMPMGNGNPGTPKVPWAPVPLLLMADDCGLGDNFLLKVS